MLWLGLAVLSLVGAIPILYVSIRQRDMWPLIAGISLALIDFTWETANILGGGWAYDESQLWIGVIPVELIIIFFAIGVIGVWLFRNLRSMDADLITTNDIETIVLVIGIGFLALHAFGTGVYYVGLGSVLGMFGVYGLLISEKRGWLILIGVATLAIDFVLETTLVGGGSYSYANGYTMDVAICYLFGAWFIGGIVTNLWVQFDWKAYTRMRFKVWDIRSKSGYTLALVATKDLKVENYNPHYIQKAQRMFLSGKKFEPITATTKLVVIEGQEVLLAYKNLFQGGDPKIPVYIPTHA